MNDLDQFLEAYLEAALWSSTDESTPQGGEPLDKNFSLEDFDAASLAKMKEDCKKFMEGNAEWLKDENCYHTGCPMIQKAGHDFWLTRCGHGAGYWDGDWEEKAGQALTEASKKFGECNLCVGDDGLIYVS